MGTQLYGYTASEHEFSVTIPQATYNDPEIVVYISAHGGGTVGRKYASNGWDYLVTENGRTVLEGSDIRSAPGRAAGHEEMARTLAVFLSAAGESFCWRGEDSEYHEDYGQAEAEWLAVSYERLSMFATDYA